jgi:hypothetical protein
MASVTSTSTPLTVRRPSWTDRPDVLDPLAQRWALRAAFAAPLVAIASLAAARGYQDGANTALVERARAIEWGARQLGFVGTVYPPIPTVIARLVPSAAALGIVGAFAGGFLLEAVHRRVRAAGMSHAWAIALVAMLALSPGFVLTATTDLANFLAITLLAVAVDGFVRFTHRGQTHGGFRAGLALGLAGLCHPSAILCAVGFAIAAPMVAHHRYRGRRAAGRATAAVLLFPTVAGLAGWTFLCWRFTGSPLGWLHNSAPGLFDVGGIGAVLSTAGSQIWLPLVLTPTLLAVVALIVRRRGGRSGAGAALPAVVLALAAGLGIGFSRGATAALLGMTALCSLPRMSRRSGAVIVAVAIIGLALNWAAAPSPALLAWEHVVFGH